MVTLAQHIETLGSGSSQQILAVIVGGLIAALAWLVRLHLKERSEWEKRDRETAAANTAKLESLHEKTLGIALKVQKTILALGDSPEEE